MIKGRVFLTLVVMTLWLMSGLLLPVIPPAQADEPSWTFVSSDLDGDGLPNLVETTGWCNTQGCFNTNPLDPDSDNDTLTDGEEKLFESIPIGSEGPNSPGLYVVYENAIKTKEYYPWQPYGHKLIARADQFIPPRPDERNGRNDLDAVVVRRGTTFSVGGPINKTLVIEKSSSSLTTLTPQRSPFTGEWQVTVPSDGTVGRYELKLGNERMDLLVIFELPKPAGELTQNGIDRFVYDDDMAVTRDQAAILLGDYRYPPQTGAPYQGELNNSTFVNQGNAYAFTTEHYTRYLLEDYVIDAINGKTSQRAAADALTEKVDALTVFRNPRVLHNSWSVLNPGSNPRQQCSNIAALLTAFNRAAGIAARPMMADWRDDTFDHSTEIWLNDEWRVYRGYNEVEMNHAPDNSRVGCSGSGWPKCGTVKYETRSAWGTSGKYRPWHSGGGGSGSVVVLGDDNWTETGTAYRWPSWDLDVIRLDETKLRTKMVEYWQRYGWRNEPVNLGRPGWPPAPSKSSATQLTSSNFQSAQVQLGDVVNEYPVDINGDGQYDELVLEVEVTASQPGRYWLRGQLASTRPDPSLMAMGGTLAEAFVNLELAGTQIVPLVFSGVEIALKRVDGPYRLSGVWITDVADPEPATFMNDSLAQRIDFHLTNPYPATAFETYGALLTKKFSHREWDSNGDGRADGVAIETGLIVDQPGEYTVSGRLFDGQNKFISEASWSGSGGDVRLEFAGVAGRVGPYQLKELRVLDGAGQAIDELFEAYTIEPIAALAGPAVASFNLDTPSGDLTAFGATITPTRSFNTQVVNGNLQLNAGMNVAVAGSYKLEAWLADRDGNLVTWAVGQPVILNPGLQTLSVTFRGIDIRARGIAGPYTVVAVKVLNGNARYEVLDSVNVAMTTPAYGLNNFTQSNGIVFADFVESGGSQWTAEAPWAIVEGRHLYFSFSPAWLGAGGDGSLRLNAPLNLSAMSDAGLKFHTSYDFTPGSAGYVEVSTNGGATWTIVATFTGNKSWSEQIEVVSLKPYVGVGKPPLRIRFRLAAAGGGQWYVDDVVVGGMIDNDGDGLSEEDEIRNGTDPNDWDTDNDGLPDGWEVLNGLNPLDPNGVHGGGGDPDNDGLSNAQEHAHGTNPRNPDTDGDGLPDGWEVAYSFDPLDTTGENGADGDPDEDRLTNLEEYERGTNPRNPDTDGDGIPDKNDPKIDYRYIFLPMIFK